MYISTCVFIYIYIYIHTYTNDNNDNNNDDRYTSIQNVYNMCIYIYIYTHVNILMICAIMFVLSCRCAPLSQGGRVSGGGAGCIYIYIERERERDRERERYNVIYIYIYIYMYIYIYIYIYAIHYHRAHRVSFHARPCPVSHRQKLHSSPWFGTLKACLPTCIMFRRSFFFAETGMIRGEVPVSNFSREREDSCGVERCGACRPCLRHNNDKKNNIL